MKSGEREITKEIELQDQERIWTINERGNYKY